MSTTNGATSRSATAILIKKRQCRSQNEIGQRWKTILLLVCSVSMCRAAQELLPQLIPYGNEGIRLWQCPDENTNIKNLVSDVKDFVDAHAGELKTLEKFKNKPCRARNTAAKLMQLENKTQSEHLKLLEEARKIVIPLVNNALADDPIYGAFEAISRHATDRGRRGRVRSEVHDAILTYYGEDSDRDFCALHVDSNAHHLRLVLCIQNSDDDSGKLIAFNSFEIKKNRTQRFTYENGGKRETIETDEDGYLDYVSETQLEGLGFNVEERSIFKGEYKYRPDKKTEKALYNIAVMAEPIASSIGDFSLIPCDTLLKEYKYLFPQSGLFGAKHIVTPVTGDTTRVRLVIDMYLIRRLQFRNCFKCEGTGVSRRGKRCGKCHGRAFVKCEHKGEDGSFNVPRSVRNGNANVECCTLCTNDGERAKYAGKTERR